MPWRSPVHVGSAAISAVHCVRASTKTRSKNSSSGVTCSRRSEDRRQAGGPGPHGGAHARILPASWHGAEAARPACGRGVIAPSAVGRHLERSIARSKVVVLNRNNSDDRLESRTAVEPGSPLTEGLDGATPRPCLAVRSAAARRTAGTATRCSRARCVARRRSSRRATRTPQGRPDAAVAQRRAGSPDACPVGGFDPGGLRSHSGRPVVRSEARSVAPRGCGSDDGDAAVVVAGFDGRGRAAVVVAGLDRAAVVVAGFDGRCRCCRRRVRGRAAVVVAGLEAGGRRCRRRVRRRGRPPLSSPGSSAGAAVVVAGFGVAVAAVVVAGLECRCRRCRRRVRRSSPRGRRSRRHGRGPCRSRRSRSCCPSCCRNCSQSCRRRW